MITPNDLVKDQDCAVTRPEVQKAIVTVLPQVAVQAAAFDCSTKVPDKEQGPSPRPLRTLQCPRGLADLSGQDEIRVNNENIASDFGLAL